MASDQFDVLVSLTFRGSYKKWKTCKNQITFDICSIDIIVITQNSWIKKCDWF